MSTHIYDCCGIKIKSLDYTDDALRYIKHDLGYVPNHIRNTDYMYKIVEYNPHNMEKTTLCKVGLNFEQVITNNTDFIITENGLYLESTKYLSSDDRKLYEPFTGELADFLTEQFYLQTALPNTKILKCMDSIMFITDKEITNIEAYLIVHLGDLTLPFD